MNNYINSFEEFRLNESGQDDNLKEDRKAILAFIGYKDWSILLRKLNDSSFSDFRYKFEHALRNVKVSMDFIDKYKDLKVFPSFMKNILENPKYNVEELIEIIEKFPEYISWYSIFYNKRIPLDYKKLHYDQIYDDSLTSFDNSVPMDIRIVNTKKALSVLK
jgi:hypothetical protein